MSEVSNVSIEERAVRAFDGFVSRLREGVKPPQRLVSLERARVVIEAEQIAGRYDSLVEVGGTDVSSQDLARRQARSFRRIADTERDEANREVLGAENPDDFIRQLDDAIAELRAVDNVREYVEGQIMAHYGVKDRSTLRGSDRKGALPHDLATLARIATVIEAERMVGHYELLMADEGHSEYSQHEMQQQANSFQRIAEDVLDGVNRDVLFSNEDSLAELGEIEAALMELSGIDDIRQHIESKFRSSKTGGSDLE